MSTPTRSPTLVHPTPTLPFPIRITLLLVPSGSTISRGTNVLYYEYSSHGVEVEGSNKRGETRTGAWECPVEGDVVAWRVHKGEVVKDASKPIVEILEPCRHEEQVNGLCLICLKDVSGIDYSGFSDASRATVAMVHDAASITVSPEVAARLESESATRLLSSRKLSLVVDLDQTIVQATVDPTVGEWIEQGKAWEEGREKRKNPNWDALKDVGRFKLSEERKTANGGRGARVVRIRREDTTYYIKPRPGLNAFLTRLSELYEMHVYTMGTRSYASQVVRLIDPTGAFFGSRVLSRDESGSLTFKNLTRLFPCNTGSAVIIDDRADVWDLSRGNLVKVVPYDFFSVGDINGTFLPTPPDNSLLQSTSPSPAPPASPASPPSPISSSPSPSGPDTPPSGDLIPTVGLALDEAEEAEKEEKQKLAMEKLQEEKLHKDKEERKLQKLMDKLQAEAKQERVSERARSREAGEARSRSTSIDRGSDRGSAPEDVTVAIAVALNDESPALPSPVEAVANGEGNGLPLPEPSIEPPEEAALSEKDEEPIERALLTNDDHELERVLRILEEIHRRYFRLYQLYAADKTKREPNVMEIIPEMKAEVLAGVHLVFSSLIPIDMPPQTTELWRQALQFGATCYTRVTKEVTHVVAGKRGTEKVRQAVHRALRIVNPLWFTDSIAAWERKREEDYPLEGLEMSTTPPIRPGEAAGEDGTVTHPNSTPSVNGKDTSRPPSDDGDADEEGASGRAGARAAGAGGQREGDIEDLGADVDLEELGELDWNEMDAELEDLMGEDDTDEEGNDGDVDGEEDDADAGSRASRSSAVRASRKRRRTESAAPTPAGSDDEGSPERKRPRRREGFGSGGGSLVGRANAEIVASSQTLEDEENDHLDGDDDEDLDDFLARDLEGMEDEPSDDDGDDGDGGIE